MPYTPPARSPASSGSASPAQSRAQPSMHQSSPPRSPGPGRPHLPRSANSATYLQKSRRSPAYQVNGSAQARFDVGSTVPDNSEKNGLAITASLRQSPPPVTDSAIPAGAIISPPESVQNSSDDEGANDHAMEDLKELSDAVRRSLDVNQEPGSPETDTGHRDNKALKIDVPQITAANARLSISARKISHSRSATESSFFDRRGSQSSQTTSDDGEGSSDESEAPRPPLLRKKSGELVKPAIRPSSRRRHSSMPGTPTYSKAVHFNDNIEQVRHFLQVDRPIAVSAGTSPIEAYDDETEFPFKNEKPTEVSWEIRVANFPRSSFERIALPARVESISLSADEKSLVGSIAVANLAFQKFVVARFTLDYWKTTSEVVAEFDNDIQQKREDGCDPFKFTIKLSDQANLETRTLLLCARYNVNGQEYWDNNDGQNFQVDFIKKAKPSPEKPVVHGLGVRPPRSRHNSSSSARGRPQVSSFDDDFTSAFDTSSQIRFRNKTAQKPALPDTPPPTRRQNPAGQQFGSRYDFGASLSAALSQAQAQLGDRSGIKSKYVEQSPSAVRPERSSFPPSSGASSLARSGFVAPATSGVESPRPEALLANKQSLDSRAYQDFVSKFCFFGSAKPAGPTNEPKQSLNGSDGAQDEISPTAPPTGDTSKDKASNNSLAVSHYVSNVSRSPQGLSPSSSRSASPVPSPSAGQSGRPHSPVSFGYPYHHDTRSSLLSESQTPTAIHG